MKENLPDIKGEVFEVGCSPGKWLAFMVDEFGVKPSGIEYSEAGMKATVRNFELLRLDHCSIWTGDFLQKKPERQFDLVMSFGFIEHFANADEVVDLHLQWLKLGGVLVLVVPNFRSRIYRLLQNILDKTIVDKHNLDTMHLDYFKHLSEKFDLDLMFLDYIGSFQPALIVQKPGVANPLQLLSKIFIRLTFQMRKPPMFDSWNSRFFSSNILGIYKKKSEIN